MNLPPQLSHQFIKFIVVGVVCTAVNYGVFYALLAISDTHYQICSAAGFIVGLAVGYPLNKAWTYQHHGKTTMGLSVNYLAVYFGSLVLGQIMLYLLVDQARLNVLLANILVIGMTTCTNFIGTKFLVFRV